MRNVVLHILLALLVIGVMDAGAQEDKPSEYQVKAVFLYNFANFVQWPDDAFEDSTGPLVIGILGDNPFGTSLADVVVGEHANGHPIEVRHWESLDDLGTCHILYCSEKDRRRLPEILDHVEALNVLTVGETPDFADQGGVIGFVIEKNRIRFEINISAANRVGLEVSSKLQKVATRVIED